MKETKSWFPASGCYPCPLNVASKFTTANINPLPGFADLHRGYFSVPLNSWYLPLNYSTDYPVEGFIAAEVDNAHVDSVLAIAAHECDGHAIRTLQTQNIVIRIAAAKAYEAILDILSTGSEKSWPELQHWNSVIADLTERTAYLEELFATFYGFDTMREQPSPNRVKLHPAKIDKLEKELVYAHKGQLGPSFPDIYKSLAWVASYAGLLPFLILTDYADDNLDYDGANSSSFPFRVNDRAIETRLRRGIEVVRALPYSAQALRRLENSDWLEIFDRWLLDFRSWRKKGSELRHIAEYIYSQHLKFWRSIGPYNPIDGGIVAHESRTQMKLIPPDAVEELMEALPELAKKQLNASANNRTLVFVSASSGYAGVTFLPLASEGNDEFIPFGDLLVSVDYSHLPVVRPGMRTQVPEKLLTHVTDRYGHDGAELWARRLEVEREMRKKFNTLLLFEGIRLQVAMGEGMCCPMRSMNWKESNLASGNRNREPVCCGQSNGIMNLWLAGKKAQIKLGYSPNRWEQPTRCPGCPLA